MVPILSGNLSVDWFSRVLSGRTPPPHGCHRQDLEEMRSLGATGVEDYVAWGAVEPRRDHWDLSFHQANRRQCEELGLAYVIYPWLHVLPPWLDATHGLVPFRCLEHDACCGWPSIFASSTLDLLARFLTALRRELGAPDALCLAVPADYGEVGYPTGWARWVAPLRPPHDHAHPGWWAGDDAARARWREVGTRELVSPQEMPDPAARAAFADFYLGAMTGFVDQALAAARAVFPDTPLEVKVGHGGESLCYGIDPTGIARTCARHGAGIRSTRATLPEFHQRRLATPARHHGVPFTTESPADVGRETTCGRLFTDAACGTRAYFDFPEHLLGARDMLARLRPVLRGGAPEVDVAVFFPGGDHRRAPTQGFPPTLLDLCDLLRDRFDHDLVDEALVADGGLAAYRVLLVPEACVLDAATQAAFADFVARGGWLVAGPDAGAVDGWLGATLAAQGDHGRHVALAGRVRTSARVDVGVDGDRLRLWGDWHPREDACQFREGPPVGERCRWSGARAYACLPVDPADEHLLEIECWVHPLTLDRRRRVRVNGVEVGAIVRGGIQRFAAWVPAEVLARGAPAEVCIDCEPFQPRALGLGPDGRELGAVVMWVRLTRRGHPAWADAADPDPLEGRVDDALWEAAAERVVALRDGPLSTYLLLAEAVVRRAAAAGGDGNGHLVLPHGVRTSTFTDTVLLWNRRGSAVDLGAAGTLDAGALALLDRHGGGRLL